MSSNSNIYRFAVSIFILIFLFQSCQDKKIGKKRSKSKTETKALIPQGKISSIEAYCWCFSLFPYQYQAEEDKVIIKDYLGQPVTDIYNCQTPINLRTAAIQTADHSIAVIENHQAIELFQDSLLSGFYQHTISSQGADVRLVFQLNKEDGSSSNLAYHSSNRMILNDSIFLDYHYRVDSLLLKWDVEIDFICSD